MKRAMAVVLALAVAACGRETRAGYSSDSRTAIRVVTSASQYGRTAAVAERFALAHPDLPAPVVEMLPEAQALALLCRSPGLRAPDIAALPRSPNSAALDACRRRGVEVTFAPPACVVSSAHLRKVQGLAQFVTALSCRSPAST